MMFDRAGMQAFKKIKHDKKVMKMQLHHELETSFTSSCNNELDYEQHLILKLNVDNSIKEFHKLK